jgi:hypothetical protein
MKSAAAAPCPLYSMALPPRPLLLPAKPLLLRGRDPPAPAAARNFSPQMHSPVPPRAVAPRSTRSPLGAPRSPLALRARCGFHGGLANSPSHGLGTEGAGETGWKQGEEGQCGPERAIARDSVIVFSVSSPQTRCPATLEGILNMLNPS